MLLSYLSFLWITLTAFWPQEETPVFKGGQKSLSGFIATHLIYPEYSKQNCLQGIVQVSFKLSSSGRIAHSKVEKGFGTDLDDEALRLVRLTSGKWRVPASFDTTQYLTLPINFSLVEYQNCRQLSPEDLRAAINAYKAQEDLTNAIVNFYRNKYAGNYQPEDETRIEQLKSQLGYNDRYVDRVLRQAQAKWKQGDATGACEDLNFVRNLGSNKADKLLAERCK